MSSATPAPAPTKGTKIKRALKSAARLPRVPGIRAGRGSGRNSFTPRAGEPPVVILRLQVLGCTDVLAKDRGGTSDPFVVASLLNNRHQTPVAKRTVNPVYAAKDATFDFPIYLSLADRLGVVELVIWDKDMLKKEYLGEVALPLEDWFNDREFAFDHPGNKPFSLNIISTRAGTPTTGRIHIKLGFAPTSANNLMEYDEIYGELVKRTRPSLVSAPPTEGLQDDGGLSSESDDSDDDDAEFVDASDATPPTSAGARAPSRSPKPLLDLYIPRTRTRRGRTAPSAVSTSSARRPRRPVGCTEAAVRAPELHILPSSPATPTPGASLPTATPIAGNLVPPTPEGNGKGKAAKAERGKSAERRRKFAQGGAGSGSGMGMGAPSAGIAMIGRRRKSDYEFKGANDIVGIVMLEIQSADDLPRLANMTRTGWDMDPFVVISFGKKVFRTRVVRHSRSPVWDEKLLFHVRRYETAFRIQLTVLDWDKLSSNDHVGDASLEVSELVAGAPQPDPVTGLYPWSAERPLATEKGMPWEAKHAPTIRFRAKYQPYDALRQRFWRQYLKQYDTDDTGRLSHLELTSMLDSLGSTLTRTTISSFFTRYGKNPHEDELTMDEAVACLETELGRPDSEKKRLDVDDNMPDTSITATPVLSVTGGTGEPFSLALDLDKLDFSGVPHVVAMDGDEGAKQPAYTTEPMQIPLVEAAGSGPGSGQDTSDLGSDADGEGDLSSSASNSNAPTPLLQPVDALSGAGAAVPPEKKAKKMRFKRLKRAPKASPSGDEVVSAPPTPGGSDASASAVERVINVKNCPLCHRPRLNSKAEMDIITHLAICASQDWNKVDRIVVGNFVTASQAQRKWYTKVLTKVSSGDYRLGANSANIIVQNRMTGQLEEEKMQVYVRLGIRLLYKGATGRMEGARARRLLKSLSIKQGVKYDDPESAKEIPTFIQFHGLKVEEILDPIDSFKTFNEFFYRKLKPTARPVEAPNDPYRLVSAADCRLMTFECVSEATRLWIKGREFTVARLLGEAYKAEAERYTGGAIGPMTYISGEYYTVNPQAIRSSLDVYGENARKIVPIDSPQFGRVMAVCVGAMMVGSIKTTVEEGDYVQKGQEFGYFAFGGSTIVVTWDEDLLINGRASLETLVRVGMGIGHGRADA
ncbi:hypothetical protein BJ912DRAFT_1035445 [Pholiota molesta]|nr:hypothetical protein BJ912DRAFT_1035445 [Pholiota molesta]